MIFFFEKRSLDHKDCVSGDSFVSFQDDFQKS